jgi:recombination protein U
MTNELEKRVNKANLRYRKDKVAVINKVEVPIILTSAGLIPKQSTVDYIGIYKGGTGIAFDAKETKSKTSFPLANIKQHQLLFLEYWEDVGGNAFFFIHFKSLWENQAFITPLSLIKTYWYDNSARRSIPIIDFNKDWLVNIDTYLEKFI